MATETSTHQSIDRAITVLRVLNQTPTGLRVAEVAKITGLGASTTSRLLAVLESQDFVLRDESTGVYRLGSALITLGGTALNQRPVYREGRSVAQRLARTLDLGTSLAARRTDALFYFCSFEGAGGSKQWNSMGQTGPLHATALGKCLVCEFDPGERRELLGDLQAYTSHTVVDHEALDAELAQVRRQGYAIERQELALGRACVAALIRDADGEICGSLSVSGSLSAVGLPDREAELAGIVIEAADEISIGLGFRAAPS
ncbi:IclR family transcriptional regulator [Microlunatus sp. GCM10028923]|uniref:IclR family transcriptional regulator n=1 Tax=Microlunatus sp. GCM10028923 TaxID=3273400 RepID=UPI00361A8B9A